jgi:hypothetical protein
VFDRTLPQAIGLSSPDLIAIGDRLLTIAGPGREPARILWWVILSHAPWGPRRRPTWASNATLGREAGLPPNGVETGLSSLRKAGMLTTPEGLRPGARRTRGRLLVPEITQPVKVVVPNAASMASLWSLCRGVRTRPAALVSTMVGLSVLAGSPVEAETWPRVNLGPAALCRFLGVGPGIWHRERIEQLVALGLLRWTTAGVAVAPTSTWDVSARALAKVQALPDLELDERIDLEAWEPCECRRVQGRLIPKKEKGPSE